MSTEDRLNELFARWQAEHARGLQVSAGELCRECPELADELSERIQRSQQVTVETDDRYETIDPVSRSGRDTSPYATRLGGDSGTPGFPRGTPLPMVPGHILLGELGRGGMGVVYKARQVGLNRLVALKMILNGAYAGDQERGRFLTEAEAAARLHHPNIVQIYQIGEHDGLPFFSLEYCDGGSLAEKMAGRPRPAAEAAHLVETLARAMQAAHDQGIIHRDLKPANVLMATARHSGTSQTVDLGADSRVVKIADFGLAKKLDEAGNTASGAVIGTPSYMAPEQAGGDIKRVGPSADIYSLGAILYECLTGRPPFRAATLMDTIKLVVTNEVVPPSMLAQVPRDLETICQKCLQKQPARRYPSAQALADDLHRFQSGEPILARPPGVLERLVHWSRQHRSLFAGLTALLVMLTIASAILAWSSYRASDRLEVLRQKEQPLRDLRGEIALYDEILTSSAVLAATTGDAQWEERYHQHEALLDAALAKAAKLDPESATAIEALDAANRELVVLEKRAFDLGRAGQTAEARSLLTGDDYRHFKGNYSASLAQLNRHLDEHSRRALSEAQQEAHLFTLLAFLVAGVVVVLLLAGAVATFSSLRMR